MKHKISLPVRQVEERVRQQRRNWIAWAVPADGMILPFYHHACFVPLPPQLQNPPVVNALFNHAQQLRVIDRPKTVLDVCIDHHSCP